jgi:IS30 family transposase
MRISHEAIYQALYIEGRGALKRELVCLPAHRTGVARAPRLGPAAGRRAHVTAPEVMISERPAEAEDRAVPGHWEGDLIIGLERSAIGTLVERTTALHDADPPATRGGLPHKPHQERPALAGYGADHDEERARQPR